MDLTRVQPLLAVLFDLLDSPEIPTLDQLARQLELSPQDVHALLGIVAFCQEETSAFRHAAGLERECKELVDTCRNASDITEKARTLTTLRRTLAEIDKARRQLAATASIARMNAAIYSALIRLDSRVAITVKRELIRWCEEPHE